MTLLLDCLLPRLLLEVTGAKPLCDGQSVIPSLSLATHVAGASLKTRGASS
ncbi:MAG TPA: hypothetical protein VFV57_06985 [Limnobacter sp.]|nr:hypothetical protein [Limnobacter sp.]